jgi:hypothetical protein
MTPVTEANGPAMFSGGGPLATFAQYFRRYRFRRLTMVYNGVLPTSSADNRSIQITYERDPVVALAMNATASTFQNSIANATAVRFISWEQNVIVPIIRAQKVDRADELYWTVAANDTMAFDDAKAVRLFQGAVTASVDAPNVIIDTKLGAVLWQFEIDLYGFGNLASAAYTLVDRSDEKTRIRVKDRGDEKLTDFVELTPKSRRVPETPPPSVRTGSRKS